MSTIRILIADDHAVVREGLHGFIDVQPDMEVVGEAEDGIEAVLKTRSLQPDVILLDLVMPRKDGVQALKEIRRENPGARILVLTSFAEYEMVFQAIQAGALGYLLKTSTPQELLQAIRSVHRGEEALDPGIAFKVIQEFNRTTAGYRPTAVLTEREIEVLKLVARGLSNHEIAQLLAVSDRTVGSHVSRILDKLHLGNRTQMALYALQEGLVKLNTNRQRIGKIT